MSFQFKKNKIETDKNVKYGSGKRTTNKWQWYILVIVILIPIFYFIYGVTKGYIFSIGDGFVVTETFYVRSPSDGYVQNIFVKNGDFAKKGSTLLEIISPVSTLELNNLEKERDTLNKKIQDTDNPELEALNKMVDDAEYYLTKTIEYRNSVIKLKEKGIATIYDVQEAERDLNEANTILNDVNRKIAESNLKHKFNIENQYGKLLREVEFKIDTLKTIISQLVIQSPIDGHVIKIETQPNEFIQKGQSLISMSSDNNFYVKAYLSHKNMKENIQIGKEVKVFFSSTYFVYGKISKIPAYAEDDSGAKSIIKQEYNKILIYIKLNDNLPQKYRIYGFPVKVYF